LDIKGGLSLFQEEALLTSKNTQLTQGETRDNPYHTQAIDSWL